MKNSEEESSGNESENCNCKGDNSDDKGGELNCNEIVGESVTYNRGTSIKLNNWNATERWKV